MQDTATATRAEQEQPQTLELQDRGQVESLQRDYSRLRFEPQLEREFAREYATKNLPRMRIGFAVAIGLYATFLTLRLFAESGDAAFWGATLRAGIILSLLTTLLASYVQRLRPYLTPMIIVTYLLYGSGISAIEVVSEHYGIDRHYEGLLLISVHCYVFSGLRFRLACFSGLLIFLTYAIGGAVGGLAGKAWAYQLFFMVLVNVLGAVGLYMIEYRERGEFLARRLLELERAKTDRLLWSILPQAVAQRLKEGSTNIAENFPQVTVLLADIVGFTALSSRVPPHKLLQLLNSVFTEFDRLADRYGLEKIKTVGDAYMAVAGLPQPREDHAVAAANMALAMVSAASMFRLDNGEPLQLRIGLHCGPVVAGVIGVKKFSYDLWGDTVNIASRLEAAGLPGSIHITEEMRERLVDHHVFGSPRQAEIKGRGLMTVYQLMGRKAF